MHKILHAKAYEHKNGPHFNEECALKAVSKMENEDGSRGPHWSLEETTSVAKQYGVIFNNKFNRFDWFVALNMIYSDYYKVIVSITNSANVKNFVEFTKAWLNDKDVDEGKMWYYYIYVMCDRIRDEEMEYFESNEYDDEDDLYKESLLHRRKSRLNYARTRSQYPYEYDMDDDYDDYDSYAKRGKYPGIDRSRATRYVRY